MKLITITITLLLFLSTTNSLAGSTTCITKDNYIASISEDLFDRAFSFAIQKDLVALQQLLDTKLVFILRAGIPVFIEKSKIFSGKVLIRPKGSSTIFVWTNLAAINCN